MLAIVPLAEIDPVAVETLLDRAFGADRRARTAYRIRDGVAAIPALSFAALENGNLVGSVQCWPVALAGDDGGMTAMTMVGPVAVEPALQRGGIGRLLTDRAIAAAEENGHDALMLIGDPEYYGRFFGFTADATADWRVPGPVERRRLLARGPAPADPGMVVARR